MIAYQQKTVRLLTILVISSILIMSCSTTTQVAPTTEVTPTIAPTNEGGLTIKPGDIHAAFANASDSFELFKQLGEGMDKDAAALGLPLTRYNNDMDGPTALNVARLMVQEKPNIILEWNEVEGVGASLAQVFAGAHLPCVGINIPVPGCAWFNISNMNLGIDGAKAIAAAAIAKGWTAENTIVLIGQASMSGWEVNDSPRYFYVTIADLMGMDKVEPQTIGPETTTIGTSGLQYDCQNTVDASYTAVKNLLPSIPADKNILSWAPNDDCTFGAWRAIDEAGRGDHTLTGGPIGTTSGLEQIRSNPSWVVEESVFIDQWPKYVLPMAVAILNGYDIPNLTPAPQVAFDKNTVNNYFDANNKVIRLPPLVPDNEYLQKTGLLSKFNDVDIPGVIQPGCPNDT